MSAALRSAIALVVLALTAADARRPQAPAQQAGEGADEAIVRALELPAAAQEVREANVPAAEVRQVLDLLRGARVPAEEAQRVLAAEAAVLSAHSKVKDWVALVRTKIAAGATAADVADALRRAATPPCCAPTPGPDTSSSKRARRDTSGAAPKATPGDTTTRRLQPPDRARDTKPWIPKRDSITAKPDSAATGKKKP